MFGYLRSAVPPDREGAIWRKFRARGRRLSSVRNMPPSRCAGATCAGAAGVSSVVSTPSTRIARAAPNRRESSGSSAADGRRALGGAGRVLGGRAGCLALVAGAIGEQQRPAPALPAVTGPAGMRLLDGPWIVRGDRAGRGAALGWRARPLRRAQEKMPFSPNARHVRGVAGERSFAGSVAWYRTTVIVPRAGDYAIRFESVNHRADGVGRRAPRRRAHRDLPALRGARAPDRRPARARRARRLARSRGDEGRAWHRTWFNFGGINRAVTIRPLGASELDSPSIVTRLRATTAVVDVAVACATAAAADHRRARDARRRAAALPPSAGSRPGRTVARACASPARTCGSPASRRWSRCAGGPGRGGLTARVGLRELRWGGGRLQLNGQPLRLRGASLQEDAPGRGDALPRADMDAIVARLKAIGANATRSQHPLSEALLERLDAAGILVWQGVGPVDAPGAGRRARPYRSAAPSAACA